MPDVAAQDPNARRAIRLVVMISNIRLIMAAYLLLYAALHSTLASLPFKRVLWHVLGSGLERWYLPAFSITAAITISPLVAMLVLFPGRMIYVAPSPLRYLMLAGQILANIGTSRAFLDAPHRFSVRAQLSSPGTPGSRPMDIRGVYCWIRDPFLLSGLASIWLTPFMTNNLLMIYLLTSIYLFLGSLHWERRLQLQFGDDYRRYQRRVPRMMPRGDLCRSKATGWQ